MNPKVLYCGALAASCVGAAHAQSSVTIYGLLDVAGAYFSRTAAVDDGMFKLNTDAGSSSRFGVLGKEDLGNGWKAIFNLEAPVDAKNGSVSGGASSGACNGYAPSCAPGQGSAFWRRNAYVGLSSSQYGELTLGRNYTAAIIKQAATLSAQPSGINTGMATTLQAQGLSNDFWNSNQVRYDSPKFGPIDFSAHVAAGEGSTGRNFGGNIRYLQGPFAASLSYQNDRDTQDDEVKWMIVSASWDFGVFKLHAAYDDVDNNGAWLDGMTRGTGDTGGRGVPGFVDSRFWSVGGAFKATPQLTISAQYYDMKEKVFDTKSKVVVVDADYALSKRTFLYAMYGYVDNNMLAVSPLWGNQNFGLITNPTLPAPLDKASTPPGAVAIQNDKASAIALGIRHVF